MPIDIQQIASVKTLSLNEIDNNCVAPNSIASVFEPAYAAVQQQVAASQVAMVIDEQRTLDEIESDKSSYLTSTAQSNHDAKQALLQTANNQESFYLDTQSLEQLKFNADSDAALREVSRQFEALFVQEMLKRMRSATEALGDEDNPLSNNANSMFQEMLDSQMAITMTKNSSFGLAEMLYQQLSGNSVESSNS